jgi:hypothetical protein
MRLRQITQKIESGAAAGHRLNQASTANTTIPLAAAIAALVATSGAAIQSKVTPTTRTASSCRGLRITDCVRRIDTWELKGLTPKLSDRRRKRPVGYNSREQIQVNRPIVQRGGGSLQRSGWAPSLLTQRPLLADLRPEGASFSPLFD